MTTTILNCTPINSGWGCALILILLGGLLWSQFAEYAHRWKRKKQWEEEMEKRAKEDGLFNDDLLP